jgi:hypothetical protein
VWRRKSVEGDEPVPIGLQALRGVRHPLVHAPAHKLIAPVLGLPAGRGIRELAHQSLGLLLLAGRHLIEDVQDFVIPAAWLLRLGIYVAERRPNPEMPIAHDQARGPKPRSRRSRRTAAQLAVDSRCPGVTATTTLRPSLNAARATSRAALSFSKPAFTSMPSTQRENDFPLIKPPRLPHRQLALPLLFQAGDRRPGERRALSEEPA